ncbi:MAG: T9SS type A sorting domain-containing protein [Cyclobacteriaceae bacterium]|nr:T9SS type A sorting domain-containing protein [Cyclobacteriaceae bacterium]
MKKTGRLVFLLLLSCSAYGQFTYTIDQSIPVEEQDKVLSMPWAGGINSAQINTMDLNGDAKDDLVIFDRTSDKVLTYLNTGTRYVYAPEYESLFPKEITQWMLLRDLNCDGKKDLFTSDPFGMVAFVNTTQPGQPLSWRPYDPGRPILTKGFTTNVNLQINASDIPVIDDIDGDGDLDILNVRFVGIGTIEYHKNLSMERTGTCDSLQMERVTQTFGNLEECDCNHFAFGGEACNPSSGGRIEHAGGKAMLTIDVDGDGDLDLFFSEENCTELSFLENKGTAETANMNSVSLFPPGNPINFMLFPAGYYEDVDFDGKRDLLASPNLYARTFTSSINFSSSLWYYKNTGTEQLPQFTFQKNNFLQDEMIDVGDYAVPAFIDADGDGDLDMFISNYAGPGFASTVRFYENTGSATEAYFKLSNADLFGFSNSAFFNVKIQFADMNADGTPDFVFTATNFQTGVTRLSFIANRSPTLLDFSGQSVQPVNFTFGQQENILIVDVDQDGRTDILIGKATGAVQYWRNTGSAQLPAYTLVNESFLGLASSTDRQNPALASADLDADGRADLVVGNQRGELTLFGDFRAQNSNIQGVSEIIFNSITETYESRNLGGRIWPVAVNLFNSDKPAIVCGTITGGLVLLKNEEGAALPDEPVVDIFPNPVRANETFSIRTDRNMLVQFYNLVGQRISNSYFVPASQEYPIQISGLLPGVYIARFSYQNKTIGKRFVVVN